MLADILVETLRTETADKVNNFDFPSEYAHLILHQNTVGWRQLFLGRFVHKWKALEAKDLARIPKKHKKTHHTASAWVNGMIKIIWQHVHKLWIKRNGHQHGVDTNTQEISLYEASANKTANKTEDLYAIRHLIKLRNKSLFYATLEDHLKSEPTSRGLRQWLLTWKPVILASFEQAKWTGLLIITTLEGNWASAITK